MFEAIHRPRRIIAGPPAGPANAPLDAVTAMQQQRFQRELGTPGPLRRRAAEVRPERPPTMPMPVVPGFARQPVRGTSPMPETPRDRPGAEARDTAQTRVPTPAPVPPNPPAAPGASGPRPRRAAASRPVAARGAQPQELPPHRDLLADPQAWKHAGLPKPAPEDWDLDLAHRVIQLCKRASPSFHSWSVTVPLDPTVLPDTELAMALSPSRLLLRFKTQSAYSMALIRRHEPRLVAMLTQALPPSREIEVELS